MQLRTGVRVVRKGGDDAKVRGIVRLGRHESGGDQGKESRSSQGKKAHACRSNGMSERQA